MQYGSLTRAVASEDGTSFVVSVKPDDYYSSAALCGNDHLLLVMTGEVTRFAAKIKLNRVPKGDCGLVALKANKSGIPTDVAAIGFELAIKNGRILLRSQEYANVYKDKEEFLLWSGSDEQVLSEEFGFVFTVHRREDMYRFEVELTSAAGTGVVASRGWQAMNVASYKGMSFSFDAGVWMDNLPGLEGWADDSLEPIEATFTNIAVNQGTREEIDALASPLVFSLSDASESENDAQSASQSVTEQPQRASKASRKTKQ